MVNFGFKKTEQVIEEDAVPYVNAMPSIQSNQTGGLFHIGGSDRHIFLHFHCGKTQEISEVC